MIKKVSNLSRPYFDYEVSHDSLEKKIYFGFDNIKKRTCCFLNSSFNYVFWGISLNGIEEVMDNFPKEFYMQKQICIEGMNFIQKFFKMLSKTYFSVNLFSKENAYTFITKGRIYSPFYSSLDVDTTFNFFNPEINLIIRRVSLLKMKEALIDLDQAEAKFLYLLQQKKYDDPFLTNWLRYDASLLDLDVQKRKEMIYRRQK